MQPSAPEILAVYLHQAGLERFDLGLVLGLDTLPFLFVALVARDVAAGATAAASAVGFLCLCSRMCEVWRHTANDFVKKVGKVMCDDARRSGLFPQAVLTR